MFFHSFFMFRIFNMNRNVICLCSINEIKKNSSLKLLNIAYFIKIRGFPEGGVGGGCKILHGSTLTNISAKFHNDTICSFGVLFMDRPAGEQTDRTIPIVSPPLKGVATKRATILQL